MTADFPMDLATLGRSGALGARLLPEPPVMPLTPSRSDYDLNPSAREMGPRDLAPACVLIPIIRRAKPTLLFTKRAEELPRHPGQVSFPGGRVHTSDV